MVVLVNKYLLKLTAPNKDEKLTVVRERNERPTTIPNINRTTDCQKR